jgi:hypothetical protein
MWAGQKRRGNHRQQREIVASGGAIQYAKKERKEINPDLDYQENWYRCSDMEKKKGAM